MSAPDLKPSSGALGGAVLTTRARFAFSTSPADSDVTDWGSGSRAGDGRWREEAWSARI